MSLENDISAIKAQIAEQVPPEVLNIIGEETDLLAGSGVAEKSLKAGDNAPAFSLPDSQGTAVSSQELLAKGPLVVTFYRGGW
jgi:hypothetical protein